MNVSTAHYRIIIRKCLRDKFRNYDPESKHKPFHYRLLGKDRMALYSFIQSLNTNFGKAIFEPVSETLARLNFMHSTREYKVPNQISKAAQSEIQDIMNDLTIGHGPDKAKETERIRIVCQQGEMRKFKPTEVDLFFRDQKGTVYLFDIKTAKPNKGNFKEFKRTLLEWVASYLADDPEADVRSFIAIPYNPYEPEPYERWTMKGMLDLNHELKVAEEFWNFLGCGNVYDDLLGCFENVGIELKPEIDDYFSRFNN